MTANMKEDPQYEISEPSLSYGPLFLRLVPAEKNAGQKADNLLQSGKHAADTKSGEINFATGTWKSNCVGNSGRPDLFRKSREHRLYPQPRSEFLARPLSLRIPIARRLTQKSKKKAITADGTSKRAATTMLTSLGKMSSSRQ